MTEYDTFSALNMKDTCRACLRVCKDVATMTEYEINAYQNFVKKINNMNWELKLCNICKWLLRKFMLFIQQCQKANQVINQAVIGTDIKHFNLLPVDISHNFEKATFTQYVGPEDDLTIDKYDTEHIVMEFCDDSLADDDDDDVPLVKLQDVKINIEPKLELLLEQDIKQEYPTQETRKKAKEKRKKQLKDGFSSRMVQETEEYVVIKLTKEQVLNEMGERAKSESYLRSPYKCERCAKGFNFEDVLQTHNEKHRKEHGSFLCDICYQYCPNPVSLRGHMKSHTTRYKCKVCGVVRLSRQHLLEHHAITHTAAATNYSCDKCSFTTNKRTIIQRHVKTHSATEHHACHKCGKLFSSIESLRVHTMRHDKSKRLQCPQCSKHFIYPSLLHKHELAVHERKEYYCVECDVRFKSAENLRLHFKKAKRHRDASSYNYPCVHCAQRFVSTASLSVHLTSVHGEAKQHTCTICPRQYSSKEALRAHTWRVHSHSQRNQRKNNAKGKIPQQPTKNPQFAGLSDFGSTRASDGSLQTKGQEDEGG